MIRRVAIPTFMKRSGSVTTATMMQEVDKDKKIQRVRSLATAEAFKYEDGLRRALTWYADNREAETR